MRSKGVQKDAPLDWVRLELQIAPTSVSRASAAIMSPDEIARSTKWTNFLCDTLGSVSAPSLSLTTRKKKPDCVDSLEHMLAQYATVMNQCVSEGYMTADDLCAIVGDVANSGKFNGMPPKIFRNYYF